MSDLNEIQLRRLDLTLLLIFLGLVKHRKAALVADDMGLTQSSISHALNRLRDILGDELFLRRPHGFEPTSYALKLEPVIREAVEQLSSVLKFNDEFSPETASGTFRISGFDSELAVLIPALLRHLEQSAPDLQVTTRAASRNEALRLIDERKLDLALGFFWDVPDQYCKTHLYDEGYVMVARKYHPLLSKSQSLETFLEAKHLIVSPKGDLTGIVDEQLQHMGLTRKISAGVPLFFPALATLSESDLIATMPSRIAKKYATSFGLETWAAPLEIRTFDVSVVHHRRDEKNPLCNWVVKQIKKVAHST